ncbi:guanine nucleotide-binding protein-like 3 [Phycodurus eques]|uniref:guanine nucleotide-binding protein-like 3 n=1 Tax=Phycodurus eques TaxID=693459 RepID=UPI002ACE3C34|nr:guanine nucleotide-binding protein-like 3 [Phycodurus eques]
MKRPKLRKASKRLSCSKRYKIQKKVREHNRKRKKEAKKKGVSRRPKKDPGVPSSAPFKEEVLREAEQRRLQIEEEKERRKQAAKEGRAKKRKQEKETGCKEKEPKAKKARQDETAKGPREKNTTIRNSKKFLCAELNKVIDASDIVIEVLDARDPMGCRCPQVEEAVLQRGGKKILFVLSKIDLVPRENVQQWIQILQQEFPVVAFKVPRHHRCIKTQAKRRRRIKPSNKILDLPKGSSLLTDLLTHYAANKEGKSRLQVGIVGFPNVGKSSLINTLKGSHACIVGVKRGVTKSMQEVQISAAVNLVDSPGILACPSNPAATMALRSLQVGGGQEIVEEAVGTLLKQCDKTLIMLNYNIANYRTSGDFLTLLARKRGFLQKGGILNTKQAASSFLDDWTGAVLRYHCKAPDQHSLPAYVTDTVVTEMWSSWDRKQLETGNQKTLKNIRFPIPANCIEFVSNGPTTGLLVVSDITEEKVGVGPNEEDVEAENKEPEQKADETNADEPEKVSPEETNHVQFKSAPINTSSSTVETDDAYDFNTYFK